MTKTSTMRAGPLFVSVSLPCPVIVLLCLLTPYPSHTIH